MKREREPMKTRSTEKRKHARFPVRVLIRYRNADRFFQDYIENISIGGIFVETADPLSIGTNLNLQFSLPGMGSPIQADGVVVHLVKGGARSFPVAGGMGIKFSELNDKNKELLEDYVRVHTKVS